MPGSIADRLRDPARAVGVLQGVYFLGTGAWPLLHMPSFLAVTGPKTDLWLVRTVGALIAVVGGTITAAAWRGRLTPELVALATGSAAALAGIDIVYTCRRRIPPVYLLDAAAEGLLLAGWVTASRTRRVHQR